MQNDLVKTFLSMDPLNEGTLEQNIEREAVYRQLVKKYRLKQISKPLQMVLNDHAHKLGALGVSELDYNGQPSFRFIALSDDSLPTLAIDPVSQDLVVLSVNDMREANAKRAAEEKNPVLPVEDEEFIVAEDECVTEAFERLMSRLKVVFEAKEDIATGKATGKFAGNKTLDKVYNTYFDNDSPLFMKDGSKMPAQMMELRGSKVDKLLHILLAAAYANPNIEKPSSAAMAAIAAYLFHTGGMGDYSQGTSMAGNTEMLDAKDEAAMKAAGLMSSETEDAISAIYKEIIPAAAAITMLKEFVEKQQPKKAPGKANAEASGAVADYNEQLTFLKELVEKVTTSLKSVGDSINKGAYSDENDYIPLRAISKNLPVVIEEVEQMFPKFKIGGSSVSDGITGQMGKTGSFVRTTMDKIQSHRKRAKVGGGVIEPDAQANRMRAQISANSANIDNADFGAAKETIIRRSDYVTIAKSESFNSYPQTIAFSHVLREHVTKLHLGAVQIGAAHPVGVDMKKIIQNLRETVPTIHQMCEGFAPIGFFSESKEAFVDDIEENLYGLMLIVYSFKATRNKTLQQLNNPVEGQTPSFDKAKELDTIFTSLSSAIEAMLAEHKIAPVGEIADSSEGGFSYTKVRNASQALVASLDRIFNSKSYMKAILGTISSVIRGTNNEKLIREWERAASKMPLVIPRDVAYTFVASVFDDTMEKKGTMAPATTELDNIPAQTPTKVGSNIGGGIVPLVLAEMDERDNNASREIFDDISRLSGKQAVTPESGVNLKNLQQRFLKVTNDLIAKDTKNPQAAQRLSELRDYQQVLTALTPRIEKVINAIKAKMGQQTPGGTEKSVGVDELREITSIIQVILQKGVKPSLFSESVDKKDCKNLKFRILRVK